MIPAREESDLDYISDAEPRGSSLPPTEGLPNLSPAEAWDLCERGAVLVDLRESYETNYRVFAVPEVRNLPWKEFRARCAELPRDKALILADAVGTYPREAARILLAAGYARIAKLSGGMIDWDRAGFPVRRNRAYEIAGQGP